MQMSYYENKLCFEIDAFDLHQTQNSRKNIIAFDVRSLEAFQQAHIVGAKSFPHKFIDETTAGDLDKSALYVTHCDGSGCNSSTTGTLKLTRLGFQTRELIGGLKCWKGHGYPVNSTDPRESALTHCQCA